MLASNLKSDSDNNEGLNLNPFHFQEKKLKSSEKFCPWKGSLPHLKSVWHSHIYRLDFFKGSYQSFRNIFKSPSSLSFGTFLLIRYGTSFLNLKAQFLHEKNKNILNCTHNNFLTELHSLATSWSGSELEKERASRSFKENMFIPAYIISSCMDVFVLFFCAGWFLYGFSALQD